MHKSKNNSHMNKRLLLGLMLFATQVCISQANPIDIETARQLAKQYIKAPRALNTSQAHSKGLNAQAVTQPVYYLFSNDEGKGFAIIASDDRLGQVVGYSTTGSLNPDSISAPLQTLLDSYTQVIETIRYDSISLPPKYADLPKISVAPLLDCTWNQDSPYNLSAPLRNGQKTYVGCVAAALSQVLYYHKWPEKRPDGMIHGTEAQALDYYDWDAMLPNYGKGGYTSYQASAMATLTRDVGQAVRMTYGPDGSWSDEAKAWYALENSFDYSVRFIEKDVMPADEYLKTIYNELSLGNPIFVIGGDHAFVFDGYDENGLVHCNWGWGGSSNGFYNINIVSLPSNIYTQGKFYHQQVALLARPKDGKHALFTEQPVVLTIQNSYGLTIKEKATPTNGTLTATLNGVAAHNMSQGTDYSYTGTVGVGLFNESGQCLHVFESPYGIMEFSSYYNNWYFNSTTNPWLLHMSEAKGLLHNGRYFLRPMCHRRLNADTDEWESWRLMYNANTIGITISNDTITPDIVATHANVALAEEPEILVQPQQYAGEMAAISVKVKNDTRFDARTRIKVKFIGKGNLEGEEFEVPTAMLNNLYLAERGKTTPWIIRFVTSYSTSTTSANMKAGHYSMHIEATYPETDDYFEDEVTGYITTDLTWPDFDVEVMPSGYKGYITITNLTLYTDNTESQTSIINPHEVSQIGFGIQSNVSTMAADYLNTQVRYQLKDLTTNTIAYTSQPINVSMPYGAGDLRNSSHHTLPLSLLSAGHTYEVHVNVMRDNKWCDIWNVNVNRRQFTISTHNPIAMAQNTLGGFDTNNYKHIAEAYNAYAVTPTNENYETLQNLMTQTPRLKPAPLTVYRLRNAYTDNGTLYLTASNTRLIGQTLDPADTQQLFCLVPGLDSDTWRMYSIGAQKYVGALPNRAGEITLVNDITEAADYRLSVSTSAYTTTITASQPADSDFPALRLGKRNTIQAWSITDETSHWFIERTNLSTSQYALSFGQSDYTTVFLPQAFVMPEGVEGAIVTLQPNAQSATAHYIYSGGNVVPALTPLLLKATQGALHAITLRNIDAHDNYTITAGNALCGTLSDTIATTQDNVYYYKLGYGDTNDAPLGFYQIKPLGTYYIGQPYKANLRLTTTEGVAVPNYIPLSEDDITHITATATPNKNMPQRFYDLQGRPLHQLPRHGIVVTPEGKKIVR